LNLQFVYVHTSTEIIYTIHTYRQALQINILPHAAMID
jgi:hypothetical protein